MFHDVRLEGPMFTIRRIDLLASETPIDDDTVDQWLLPLLGVYTGRFPSKKQKKETMMVLRTTTVRAVDEP